MRAKEYFEKYKVSLMSSEWSDSSSAAKDLLVEMSEEINCIAKQRKATTDKAFLSIINEMNQRWNAVCNLLRRAYGYSVLADNGFRAFWYKKLDV